MFVEFLQENLHWVVLLVLCVSRIIWLLSQSEAKEVSPAEATLLMNREHGVLIDVRPAGERQGGFIPKARLIALEALEEKLVELDKYKARPIVLYAGGGKQVAKAYGLLRKKGFNQVFTLAGGIDGWKEAGLPLITK